MMKYISVLNVFHFALLVYYMSDDYYDMYTLLTDELVIRSMHHSYLINENFRIRLHTLIDTRSVLSTFNLLIHLNIVNKQAYFEMKSLSY